MGFGGKVYESIGNYDLVINKALYPIIKLLNFIINKFKNISIPIKNKYEKK